MLFLILAVVVVILFLLGQQKKRGSQPSSKEKLKTIRETEWRKKSLLNQGEQQLFREIHRLRQQYRMAWLVCPQVCLGELIGCQQGKFSRYAFSLINSKRFDFALVQKSGSQVLLVAAVEYDGGGHHQGNASERDAVKNIVCEKLGVPLIRINANELNADSITAKFRTAGLIDTLPANRPA